MDQKIKKGIFFAIGVPILCYLSYTAYTEMFPDTGPGGNVPASMESLPKLPEPTNKPSSPLAQNPAPAAPNPANPQNPLAPQTPAQPNQVPKPAVSPKPNPPKKEEPKKQSEDKPIVLATSSLFGENPFVEMNILSEEHKIEQGKLPAIPNMPVPNVSNVPIPPPPAGVAIPTPPSAASAPVLTGTIESSSGAKIALMSDGQVVTEGDNYGDGHIAYIGGGSVQFDDGKTMDLVNSIQVNRTTK